MTGPVVNETAAEEARRVANWLLNQLPPEQRESCTIMAHAAGMRWLGSGLIVYQNDRAIPTNLAAELVCVPESTIRRWASTPHPADPSRMLLPRHKRVGRQMTYLASDVRRAAEVSEGRRRTRLASSRRVALSAAA